MDVPEGYKRCTKGEKCVNPLGSVLPATREYFYKEPRSKNGLRWECKVCTNFRAKEWSEANPEKVREAKLRWRKVNAEKERQDRRLRYHSNIEKEREVARRRRKANPEKEREKIKRYRKANPEKVRDGRQRWRKANPVKVHAQDRRYREANREKMRERDRMRRITNPENRTAIKQRRRARERSLPATLTSRQWNRAIDYFNGCCAVCERQLRDLFATHTVAADHWIPLNSPDCPGTVAENMIPLCHGVDGCNNSKSSRNPADWLSWKFGKRKARQIAARIEAYFEWVRQQDSGEFR